MLRRKILPALAAAVLPATFLSLGVSPAQAAPVPTDYSGSAESSILSTEVNAGVLGALIPGFPALVAADLGPTSAEADSTATPRTAADGANIVAGALGGALPLAEGHSQQPGAPATDDWQGVAADLSPVANVGLLSGTTEANWSGDDACVPVGTPLSRSTTSLAEAQLLTLPPLTLPLPDPLPAITAIDLGAAETSSTTELADNGAAGDVRNVVSTATANLADLSLLNGLVQVDVQGDASLVSTATGTAATTETVYDAPTISVTANGDSETLRIGQPHPLTVTLIPGIAAQVTLTMNDVTDTGTGLTAAGSVPAVLSVEVSITGLGLNALTASLDLFPLSTSATAPAGGVECPLPAPVITSPADGDWTTPTPTITGTGEPGATVNVSVDGTPIGTTTVAGDGSWNLPVTTALAPGAHDAVATQTVGAMTSPESNNPTFNVAAAPVITAPADGSSTTDRTPDIDGTGEPGAQIEVFVDGDSLGTTTVAPDGTWTITPTAPLALGEHTVDATQTDLGQLTQDAEPVTFEVIDSLAPPVITAPEDGSSTDDTTPDIEGEGSPGATVEVTIDDEVVGTTQVDQDGTWTLELTEELSCGEHTVTATQALRGLVSDASAPVTFTVTCAQGGPDSGEPTTTPTAGSLPDTGSPAGMAAVALIGLGLLGAGALLLRRLHA